MFYVSNWLMDNVSRGFLSAEQSTAAIAVSTVEATVMTSSVTYSND